MHSILVYIYLRPNCSWSAIIITLSQLEHLRQPESQEAYNSLLEWNMINILPLTLVIAGTLFGFFVQGTCLVLIINDLFLSSSFLRVVQENISYAVR